MKEKIYFIWVAPLKLAWLDIVEVVKFTKGAFRWF